MVDKKTEFDFLEKPQNCSPALLLQFECSTIFQGTNDCFGIEFDRSEKIEINGNAMAQMQGACRTASKIGFFRKWKVT